MQQEWGLSLVELIISVAIGAFVAMAGSALYVTTVATGTEVFDRTQATEQGRAIVDTIMQDFRRVGYRAGTLLTDPISAFTVQPSVDIRVGAAPGEAANSCLIYHYELPTQDAVIPVTVTVGFRRITGIVQLSEVDFAACNDTPEADHWAAVTEPEVVTIDHLQFTALARCMDADTREWLGDSACANYPSCGDSRTCRERRRLDISLCSTPAGSEASCQLNPDSEPPEGQLRLNVTATSRNDRVLFARTVPSIQAMGDGAGIDQPNPNF